MSRPTYSISDMAALSDRMAASLLEKHDGAIRPTTAEQRQRMRQHLEQIADNAELMLKLCRRLTERYSDL